MVIYCNKHIHYLITEAIIDFEHSGYIFPEGSTGEVCLTITNNVTLIQSISHYINIIGYSYLINYYIHITVLFCALVIWIHLILFIVGSCSSSTCGGYTGSCFCDQICFGLRDCCYNVIESCPSELNKVIL